MSRSFRAILVPCLVLLSFIFSPPALLAQENGVQHPLVLAELTYGESIDAMVADGTGGFWFGGTTCSTTLPTTSNAIQKTWSGQPCISTGMLGRMKSDGTITYLSYFGGSGPATSIRSLALGPGGNLYVAGWTNAADFPTTAGAYARTCGKSSGCNVNSDDGFVAELTPDGSQMIFGTYLGGSANDQISSIAVDSNGLVHVAGLTFSADFPVTAGALQPTYGANDNADGFYARLSADGSSLSYSTYLGGSGWDTASGVALDSGGDAYVAGTTGSSDFPTFNPADPNGPPSAWSIGFLARFSSSGPVYSTYIPEVANAVGLTGGFVYTGADEVGPDFGGGLVELTAASGAVTRTIDLPTANGDAHIESLAVDSNRVVYAVGFFTGNDCGACGPESERYPTTWDAYKRQLSGSDTDAVLSIVDFRPPRPTMLYSTMLGGSMLDVALAVMPDGTGGAYLGGYSQGLQQVNGQPPPPMDPGAAQEAQSFVAHVSAQQVTMPTAPPDIVLYAYDLNGISPTAIAGNWKVDFDQSAAGGSFIHQWDQGTPKVATPEASPQNYFELEFLAQANTPYHLWLRMKAQNDSYQNDSVWVQFSDSIDAAGNPVWRIGSTDGTAVSLEDCSGCGDQGWGWNDNGYGTAGTPVIFATSGWHTIRIQQREDGVSIDQIVLSSSQWTDTAPGANKNDSTILGETSEVPGDQPPTVSITSPSNGGMFTAGSTITIDASADDRDGSVSAVDFYANGTYLGTDASAPWEIGRSLSAGTYNLTAVATDNQGAHAMSPPVAITVVSVSTLPSGWTDADIGNTGAAGSATYSNGTFTVLGAGADVWYSSDAFNYAYMLLTDNAWIVARVATVSDQAAWVKAGVMIRSSLDPSSAQAFMLVSHAKGTAFQRRTSFDGGSVSTPGAQVTAPYWVKLVRNGSTISGYESADGTTWTLVGSDTFTNLPTAVYAGLAVSSHVSGTLATATFDSVQTSTPTPWENADIGSVPIAGGAGYSDGTFTVTGSGADIWGTADAFHYTWQLLNGDGAIVARVASVQQDVSPWVKAGLMMRNTFDPGSVHAMVLVSAAKGVAFQRRDIAGGTSVSTPGSSSTAPHWIKLARSGNTFTAYESADGANWTEIGSDTIAMAQEVYVGLAVTSHSTSAAATCTFDHVSIQ